MLLVPTILLPETHARPGQGHTSGSPALSEADRDRQQMPGLSSREVPHHGRAFGCLQPAPRPRWQPLGGQTCTEKLAWRGTGLCCLPCTMEVGGQGAMTKVLFYPKKAKKPPPASFVPHHYSSWVPAPLSSLPPDREPRSSEQSLPSLTHWQQLPPY